MHSKGILEVKKYENVSIPIFIFIFLARCPRYCVKSRHFVTHRCCYENKYKKWHPKPVEQMGFLALILHLKDKTTALWFHSAVKN